MQARSAEQTKVGADREKIVILCSNDNVNIYTDSILEYNSADIANIAKVTH